MRAGESSGSLDAVFCQLAETLEKNRKIHQKILSVVLYPLILLFMAVVILGVLIGFVIPKFQLLFQQLLHRSTLPPLTQFIVDSGSFIKSNYGWIITLMVCVLLVITGINATRTGRLVLRRSLAFFPVLGMLIKTAALARFTRALSSLLQSGVPILQALEIAGNVITHSPLRKGIHQLIADLQHGISFTRSLEALPCFPPLVTSMVEVGENTGRLAEVLGQIAQRYEEETDLAGMRLARLIEPVLVIGLAFVVGIIVLALFQPIVSLIQNMSGG